MTSSAWFHYLEMDHQNDALGDKNAWGVQGQRSMERYGRMLKAFDAVLDLPPGFELETERRGRDLFERLHSGRLQADPSDPHGPGKTPDARICVYDIRGLSTQRGGPVRILAADHGDLSVMIFNSGTTFYHIADSFTKHHRRDIRNLIDNKEYKPEPLFYTMQEVKADANISTKHATPENLKRQAGRVFF